MTAETFITLGVCWMFLCTGYWMGRLTITRDGIFTTTPDQGSTDEPPGDLFNDAMSDRDDAAERINTAR